MPYKRISQRRLEYLGFLFCREFPCRESLLHLKAKLVKLLHRQPFRASSNNFLALQSYTVDAIRRLIQVKVAGYERQFHTFYLGLPRVRFPQVFH